MSQLQQLQTQIKNSGMTPEQYAHNLIGNNNFSNEQIQNFKNFAKNFGITEEQFNNFMNNFKKK